MFILSACNCGDGNTRFVINDTESYKQAIDSLNSVITVQRDSLEVLYKHLQKADIDQQVSRMAANKTISKLREALNKKDTPIIIDYAEECEENFRDFLDATDTEDSIQTAIIARQDSTIKLQTQIANAHVTEYAKVKGMLELEKKTTDSLKKSNDDLGDKLKRSKWIARHTAPIALVGATALIAPPFTPLAVAGGVVLYLVTKPKHKKR